MKEILIEASTMAAVMVGAFSAFMAYMLSTGWVMFKMFGKIDSVHRDQKIKGCVGIFLVLCYIAFTVSLFVQLFDRFVIGT